MSLPTCPSCVYAKGICKKTGVEIRATTGCTYHTPKPITNADKIRAMTDEELAEWFIKVQDDIADYYDWGRAYPPELPTMKNTWLDWLKQEASDD